MKVKPSLRIVNGHYQLWSNQRINLQRLNEVIGKNGRLHQGRPTMVTCHMMTKRVQFFPNGTIQILGGGVTLYHLYHLFRKVYQVLKVCNVSPQVLRLSPWRVNNAVFHFDLCQRFKFDRALCNKDFSYEPELFPAALISKWSPIHITLFVNGKGMITGLKTTNDALHYLRKLLVFLRFHVAHT